jgi:hypothetical protein
METPNFDVVISGGTVSLDHRQRAINAAKEELPDLNEEEKEIARKRGISEEEYARRVLLAHYGEDLQRERGKVFGERIQKILEGLGSEYKLDAVIRQGTQLRWLARIEVGGKVFAVAIPMELADDIIDAGSDRDISRLRNLVFFGVGRQDLISKH